MEANVAWGFLLVVLSGLCAPAGASVIWFMKSSQTAMLSASISLAAGVMVFVSLAEVLGDAIDDLRHGGLAESVTKAVAYAAFFGGIMCCSVLDVMTDYILKAATWHSSLKSSSSTSNDSLQSLASSDTVPSPAQQLFKDADMAGHKSSHPQETPGIITVAAEAISQGDERILDLGLQEAASALKTNDDLQLARTSLLIGLALGFHNLPEGLATLVGFMSSPHLGITIAIAIAIHNLPEGIAIGVPVYFATGSRRKAICYAAISGMAEPVGALIGLAVHLSGHLSVVAMGIIMSLVAGIMTGVAFRELIPRALQYDPSNRYAALGIFSGMAIMALSLVLLGLWQP